MKLEKIAFFAGSFDPFTIGHLDILKRGLRMFDRVVVTIGINRQKNNDPAAYAGRLEQVRRCIEHLPGAEAMIWGGLTCEAAEKTGARFLLRGARTAADFQYEMNMADANALIAPWLETVILPARPEFAAISSSLVRELSSFGYDVSRFLPDSENKLK